MTCKGTILISDVCVGEGEEGRERVREENNAVNKNCLRDIMCEHFNR